MNMKPFEMIVDGVTISKQLLQERFNGLAVEHCPKSLTFETDESGRMYNLHTFKARAFLKGCDFPFESYGQGKTIDEAEQTATINAVGKALCFIKEETAQEPSQEKEHPAPTPTLPVSPPPKVAETKKDKIVNFLQPVHPAIETRDEHPTTVEVPTTARGYFFAIAKERGITRPTEQRVFLAEASRADVTDERFQACAEALQHWGQEEINHLFDVINAPHLPYLRKAWGTLPDHMKKSPLYDTKEYLKTILPAE